MAFKHMLLAASAVALLTLPAVSFAQNDRDTPGDKKGDHPEGQGKGGQAKPQAQPQPQGQARPQGQPQSEGQARPQAQPTPQAQGRPQRQPNPQAQARPQEQAPPQAQARPQEQGRSQRQPNSQAQARPDFQGRPQEQARPQAQARPDFQGRPQEQGRPQGAPPPRRDTAAAAIHVQQRDQWRSGNADWSRGTVWQRDPNWWRGNEGFRNYTGVRLNFFFAPSYGYYNVPRQYWGHRWNIGAYLPAFFLSYIVRDYRDYGLPPPPDGCSWVWVNNSVLLVDRTDGYILDEIDNVY